MYVSLLRRRPPLLDASGCSYIRSQTRRPVPTYMWHPCSACTACLRQPRPACTVMRLACHDAHMPNDWSERGLTIPREGKRAEEGGSFHARRYWWNQKPRHKTCFKHRFFYSSTSGLWPVCVHVCQTRVYQPGELPLSFSREERGWSRGWKYTTTTHAKCGRGCCYGKFVLHS